MKSPLQARYSACGLRRRATNFRSGYGTALTAEHDDAKCRQEKSPFSMVSDDKQTLILYFYAGGDPMQNHSASLVWAQADAYSPISALTCDSEVI